ncbi:MAG: NADH-quinone oxidoreductase subunit H [Candidatus Eisenbacteria bacterium RBG_16_71_46]|nr:MAG: NADH-quinone oxidoreductase subunit H [Candidatus Eisenbacteria bacterium RBG_16_71_46]OGF22677.1 MAG: NADH-quinone oxidoreductase subunit H [Candidatus Eisenbacteria bacterium RBG_19FT_COMBO_70_11]
MTQIWSNPDVQFVVWALVKIVVILFAMLGVVSYLIYAERKIAGHIQARTGPNRVGPLGLFQPIADVLKLFFKEEFMPAEANKVIFHIAPILAVVPALVTFSVVPFGPSPALVVTDVNVGLLLFLAMSSLGVYAITLGGWSSNNKYALLGGMRSSAQMISYELAMGLSTIGVLILAGSLSLSSIVAAQSHWWFVVFQPLAFIIFMLTAFAETNRAPFDLPEAEAELVAGFHTEYSSMKFGMFFLGEFMNVIAICAIAVTLFLGGWNGPGPPGLGMLWFVLKLSVLLFCFIWVRWTFPRLRYDQLMNLGWKVLLPAALLNIVLTAVAVYWGSHR